jgi:putative copper resistance protein D
VLVLREIRDPRHALDTDVALRRFSGLGHAAVALALASGVANSWFVLRDTPLSLTSTYQLLLLIKVALVGSMCILALVNRYVFMRAIPTNDPGARGLRDGTIAELVIGTGVIALVSVIGLLSPS